MIYSDYKDAAERHLEVCLQLLHNIEENYKKKEPLATRQEKEKQQLLADLYYLSGYIIECSYSCAIYKTLSWTTQDVNRLQTSSTVHNVSCFLPRRGSASAAFTIRQNSNHSLSGNTHFFQTIIPTANLSTVPIIGINLSSTHPAFDLFENWNAEIRYLIDSSIILDYVGVFEFFYLANEVYEGLLTNSMI
jgi:hypothetical protein